MRTREETDQADLMEEQWKKNRKTKIAQFGWGEEERSLLNKNMPGGWGRCTLGN